VKRCYNQKMTRRLLLPSLLLVFFVFLLVAPSIVSAQEASVNEASWFDRFLDVFTDPLDAITHLVGNIIAIAVLIFTGIAPVLGIAAGIAYGAMLALSLVATGIFALIKPLILATLSVPVAGPEAVAVVQEGWRFSRDIVSMFFIVIIAFIGLATTLRWRTYQMQKTLPALLIIALLINFSGLLVGLMVDMANILTVAFLNPIAVTDVITGPLGAAAEELWETIQEIPIGLFGDDPLTFFVNTLVAPVAGALAKAIFYLFFIIILLVILLLFVIRIGILWILTILAPFAFAAYILPSTRKFWTQWWEQLFQWAFMGVPMAFFLLLAMMVASTPPNLAITSNTWFGDILINFIQPSFVLLFLLVGFIISITFVPKGAQFVTSSAQRGITTAGKVAGVATAKGGWKAAKSPAAAFQSARQAYTIHRGLGKSRRQAFGHAVERAGAAGRLETTGELRPREMMRSVKRGVSNTIKSSAVAGWKAAIKAKKKNKGFECPRCKHKQSKSVDFCENCGFMF
jgi:hypothetical protein